MATDKISFLWQEILGTKREEYAGLEGGRHMLGIMVNSYGVVTHQNL